jgi:hypothetical protein
MLTTTIDTDVGKTVIDIYKGHHIPLILRIKPTITKSYYVTLATLKIFFKRKLPGRLRPHGTGTLHDLNK